MIRRIAHVFLDVLTAGLLAVAAIYLAHSALKALRDPQTRANIAVTQAQSCVIRLDVCRIAAWLRDQETASVELSAYLTPEIHQRIAEFAYPIRLQKNAPWRVDLCARRKGEEPTALRVQDIKRATEKDTDVCVFARR